MSKQPSLIDDLVFPSTETLSGDDQESLQETGTVEADKPQVVQETTVVPETQEVDNVPQTNTNQPVDTTQTDISSEEVPQEESSFDPFLSDFSEAESPSSDQNTNFFDEEVPSGEENQSQPLNFSANFFANVSKEIGMDVTNEEGLITAIKTLQEKREVVNRFPGASNEDSQLIFQAVDEGILRPEEIASGELIYDPMKSSVDDLVFDMLQDQAVARGETLTKEQIEEQIDELGEATKRALATNYAQTLSQKRQQVIQKVSQALNAKKAKHQQIIANQQKDAARYREDITNVLRKVEDIPGTNSSLSLENKKQIAKALTDQKFLERIVFGNSKDPQKRIEHAVYNISRMAYAGRIHKELSTGARNQARQEIIDEASNITVGKNNSSQPISTQLPSNNPYADAAQQIRQSWLTNE